MPGFSDSITQLRNSIRTMREVIELMGRNRGHTSRILAAAQDGQAVVLVSSGQHRRSLQNMAGDQMLEGVQIECLSNTLPLRGNSKPVLLDNELLMELFHRNIVSAEYILEHVLDRPQDKSPPSFQKKSKRMNFLRSKLR